MTIPYLWTQGPPAIISTWYHLFNLRSTIISFQLDLMCILRLLFSVYFCSQNWHWYDLPSCMDLMCLLRVLFCVNFFSQCWHWYVLPSCMDLMCLLRVLFSVYFCSQYWHWYVLPSCMDWICVLRLDIFLNFWPQCGHIIFLLDSAIISWGLAKKILLAKSPCLCLDFRFFPHVSVVTKKQYLANVINFFIYAGCPKIKLALGKHLKLALHKRDKTSWKR